MYWNIRGKHWYTFAQNSLETSGTNKKVAQDSVMFTVEELFNLLPW